MKNEAFFKRRIYVLSEVRDGKYRGVKYVPGLRLDSDRHGAGGGG